MRSAINSFITIMESSGAVAMARLGAAGWGLAILAGLALLGCEDPNQRQAEAAASPEPAPPPGAPQGRPGAALQAAEEKLRTRLGVEGPLTLRAVHAYRQSMPDTLAICGQVNPAGRGGEPFLPWVAVVSFTGTTPTRTDFFLAASSQEATRVYYEMVDRCFDGGGAASARQGIRPLPPAPSDLPRSATDTAPRSLPQPAPELAPVTAPVATPAPRPAPAPAPALASGPAPAPLPSPLAAMAPAMAPALAPGAPISQVAAMAGPAQAIAKITTRQPANIRAGASGAAEVVRVAQRGQALQLFREGPGGWLEVGDGGEAWGWVHSSLVER